MIRILILSTLAALTLTAPVASAKGKSKGDDAPYTVAQFKSDCDLSGGKASVDGTFVSCDYPGDDDIICDKGKSGVSNCEPGIVMKRRPTRPAGPMTSGLGQTSVFKR